MAGRSLVEATALEDDAASLTSPAEAHSIFGTMRDDMLMPT